MYSIIGIVTVTLLVFITWRFASRRQSLPCPVWLRWLVELDNPFTKTNRSAVIIDHLDLQPGMVVLDMGCSPGRVAIPAAQKVGRQGKVVAVDIQAGMLRAMSSYDGNAQPMGKAVTAMPSYDSANGSATFAAYKKLLPSG